MEEVTPDKPISILGIRTFNTKVIKFGQLIVMNIKYPII